MRYKGKKMKSHRVKELQRAKINHFNRKPIIPVSRDLYNLIKERGL